MKNFEEITQSLNGDELQIVNILVKRFREKPGKKHKITSKELIAGLKKFYNIKTTGPRIRKVIQHIRVNNLLTGLIATSEGYWVTRNPEELESWILSMKERESSIRATREAVERDLVKIKENPNKKLF